MGRGNKNGRKIKRIFIFMCAELSDIPTGPCLGFYVIPGANDDDDEEEEEKHEFVHAPLLKSCHDDDDDDDKEEKGYNSTTDDEVPKLKPQRQPLRRHHHHNHSVLGGGSKWKKIDGNFDYTAIRQAIETNRMFALSKGGKSKAKFSHKVLPQTSSSSVSGDFAEDDDDPPSPNSNNIAVDNILTREKRIRNLLDREEGDAVQYLALGGYKYYIFLNDENNDEEPARIISGLHAGPGQLTFGWSHQQRADLALFFLGQSDKPNRLYFHNHHGSFWHYKGHAPDCSLVLTSKTSDNFIGNIFSQRADEFRVGLAACLSAVAPEKVVFRYSITTSCHLFHGTDAQPCVPGLKNAPGSSEPMLFSTATAALVATSSESYLSSKMFARDSLTESEIRQGVYDGSLTGFVTLTGGRESKQTKLEDPAGSRFGFCVQNYAPSPAQISDYTKAQIKEMNHLRCDSDVDKFILAQPPRTLTSATFHSEETVSTSYLRWLMHARGFDKFKITHLMLYKFCDYPKDFLEPVLQTRHESKKAGNSVAAECLKLVGNGSFGYNGLETSNYARVRLMTQSNLEQRRTIDMAVHSIKHITCLGVVKVKTKAKQKKKKTAAKSQRRQRRCNPFADSEARDDEDDDDDDDDDDDEEEEEHRLAIDNDSSSDDDADDDEHELNKVLGIDQHDDGGGGGRDEHYKLELLFAVEMSGKERSLFNNLPKAVAVLSNSKRLFFSHLDVMFRCLDPALAELCYVDTDSCIWSFTFSGFESNLLPHKKDVWAAANIIADENAAQSCHGKMKLEGIYDGGFFKTSKIYRLFSAANNQAANDDDDDASFERYTRCKGINRWIANRLDDDLFDSNVRDNLVVHRSCLRPTRTGEIHLNHESRSLMKPFNLKRRVVGTLGIHTVAFSE